MSSQSYTIGEVGRLTGTKTPTIRYYEQIGLLTSADRTDGNQRRYDEIARDRLAFVCHARELGFTLDAVRDLLSLSDDPDRSCERADRIAREQLEAVRRRLGNLTRLKVELERMIVQCEGGRIRDCRVIQTLANHALCLDDRHPAPETNLRSSAAGASDRPLSSSASSEGR